MHTDRITDLELLLGHHFRDRTFIENALSHSSIKTDDLPSNERMEFLGDSVLGLVVADALYRRFPDDEGTLTRIKSQAVSRATLQRIAQAMGLDRYILVGKGVAKREIPPSLLGNMFEAIVGAIYLDSGLAASRKFVLRHLDVVIEEIIEDRAERNYKSILQHYCQRDLGAVPTYRVIRESGPAHGRAFEVAMIVSGKEYGRAKAASKKEAEQGAARAALIHFQQVDESAKDVTTRGAGTVVRVGGKDPVRPKRRRRSRREPVDAERARTPAREKEGSGRRRRGTRGGRRRKKTRANATERGQPRADPAPEAPKKKATKKVAKKAAPTKSVPRKKTRTRPRRKKKKTGE